MTQSLLTSRLLASAQSAPEQMQPDFEAQYTEFVSIAQSILYSDIGYLAIAQSLDEALGLLDLTIADAGITLDLDKDWHLDLYVKCDTKR